MAHLFRAETPAAAGSRWPRRTVLALSAIGAGAALVPAALRGSPSAAGGAPAGFRLVSQILTGEADLDPVLVERYWAAFVAAVPEVIDPLRALSRLASSGTDAQALMAAAQARGVDAAARALTAAWFTGTVGAGAKARTVAYAEARMYATVADGLAPPTYALGGPAWWTAPPPAALVSPPTPKAAPSAPVTGTPTPPGSVSPPSARQPAGDDRPGAPR